jgi:hypothetical protein
MIVSLQRQNRIINNEIDQLLWNLIPFYACIQLNHNQLEYFFYINSLIFKKKKKTHCFKFGHKIIKVTKKQILKRNQTQVTSNTINHGDLKSMSHKLLFWNS